MDRQVDKLRKQMNRRSNELWVDKLMSKDDVSSEIRGNEKVWFE